MGYRTLVIRRRVEEIPPEQLAKFLEVQERFRQWATEWYKSGFKAPLPGQNPLKYFAKELNYAMKLIPVNGLKSGIWKVPLPFDAEMRLGKNAGDNSRGVLVDLVESRDVKQKEKVIKVRKWSGERGNTIVIRLRKSEVKWIEERIREGAQLKFALTWVGKRRDSNIATFNVALVFYREVVPYQPKRLLVVDLNALHNGVVYAVVEEARILEKSVLRPDLGRIGRLEREAARLDSLCAEKGGIYCRRAVEIKSRLWRLWRQWTIETAKKIVKLATQYKAAVVVDKPVDESVRELKESDKVKPGAKKYLNVGRFTKRLRELAEWHGVPYAELRLYSTVCPKCGAKMEELPNRRVKCQCGFEANRDEVPIIWAQKRFREIIPLFSQHDFQPSHLHFT